MDTSSLLWIAGIWLIANAVFPLFLSSLERQYQPQIDSIVRSSINRSRRFIVRVFQLMLIVVMLPSFLIVTVAAKLAPQLVRTNAYLRDILLARNATFERDFPLTYMKLFRAWRNKGQGSNALLK
jgi:O-antigen ligase